MDRARAWFVSWFDYEESGAPRTMVDQMAIVFLAGCFAAGGAMAYFVADTAPTVSGLIVALMLVELLFFAKAYLWRAR